MTATDNPRSSGPLVVAILSPLLLLCYPFQAWVLPAQTQIAALLQNVKGVWPDIAPTLSSLLRLVSSVPERLFTHLGQLNA